MDGSGIVTQGNMETECYRGDKFFIGIEMRHRMAAGKKGLTI